jgi:hypothetical protein
MASDPRFASNRKRVEHRKELIEQITSAFMEHPREHWIKKIHGKGLISTWTVDHYSDVTLQSPFCTNQQHSSDICTSASYSEGAYSGSGGQLLSLTTLTSSQRRPTAPSSW